jgi:hypothetical protein
MVEKWQEFQGSRKTKTDPKISTSIGCFRSGKVAQKNEAPENFFRKTADFL